MPISKTLSDAQQGQDRRDVITGGSGSENQPDYECAAYQSGQKKRKPVQDVAAGTQHMRAQKEAYLPKFGREEDDDYESRRKRAVLFNAVERTINGLTGMVFRKDPILGPDTPDDIVDNAENIDMAGRSLAVFAKDVFRSSLRDALSFVHVEFPHDNRPRAMQRVSGTRPYWLHIDADDMVNWDWDVVDGKVVITLAVYKEVTTEREGAFGSKDVTRYRVFEDTEEGVFWSVWEQDSNGAWRPTDDGKISLPYVPIFPCYTNRTGVWTGDPVLLDLAYLNIEHWQTYSEHQNARTKASVPIFFGKQLEMNKEGEELKVSPHFGILTDSEHGDAKYIETSGKSLAETRQDLKDLEVRMAALGLAMLSRETRAAETAEAKLIDKSESDSALSTAARGLQDCLNNCLQAHADYLKLGDGGSVTVNKDFREATLIPALITELRNMRAEGDLARETFWRILQDGEVLPDDFNAADEEERLATEGPTVTPGVPTFGQAA